MLQPIAKNPYLDALLKLMLFTAMIHMVNLAVFSAFSRSFSPLNYFGIIDLGWVFPDAVGLGMPFLIGALLALGIYLLFLASALKRKKNSRP